MSAWINGKDTSMCGKAVRWTNHKESFELIQQRAFYERNLSMDLFCNK